MEEVHIVTRDQEVIGLELSRDAKMFSIPQTMAFAYAGLEKCIKENHLTLGKVVYTRYRDVDWAGQSQKSFFSKLISMFTQVWKMDMGIEVKDLSDAPAGFKKGVIEKGSYVQYKHTGPYSSLNKGYKKVSAYIEENRVKIEPVAYDLYLNDPKSVSRDKLETLILVKVKE